MKKLIFNLFFVFGSLSLLFLVSCSDDDDDIFNEGPTINVQVNGEDTGPFEAGIGQTIVLDLNVTDNDGIDSVVVKKIVGGTEVTGSTQVIYPSSLGGDVSEEVEVVLSDVGVDDEVTLEITAYDGQGNSNTETIVLNVSAIGKYTTVLLYAPLANETSKTFFSTSTGQTYSVNDVINAGANPISVQVDIGYYYGATNNATLASPQQLHNIGIYDLSDWNTRNTTQFRRTTISSSVFLENEGNVEYISDAFDSAPTEGGGQQVANLQEGDVIAFKLSEGRENKSGLIRVSKIEPGDGEGDYIEIDVLISLVPGAPTSPGTGTGG